MFLQVRCPECGETLEASVQEKYLLASKTGITPIAFTHGNPEHVLIIYLDKAGNHRGYEILKSVVSSELVFDDILYIIGKKELARLLAAIVQEAEIYVNIDVTTGRFLQKFLTIIGQKKLIRIVNEPKKAKYIFDFLRKKTDKVIGEKYFIRILSKAEKLASNRSKLSFLEMTINKLNSLINEAKQIIETERISPEKILKAKVNLDSDAWEIIEAALVNLGFKDKLKGSILDVIVNV